MNLIYILYTQEIWGLMQSEIERSESDGKAKARGLTVSEEGMSTWDAFLYSAELSALLLPCQRGHIL